MTLTRETVTDLVKRLRRLSNDLGGGLMDEAADALLAAWDERDALQKGQTYSYIGRDGKTVLARDLEDRADTAEAKLVERDAENARLRETLDNLLDAITATDQIGDRVLSIKGSTANLLWLIETIEDSRATLNKEPKP